MKSDRFTDAQIMGVIRQAEGGVPVPDLCREHGISNATFYRWRAKYGGMDASTRISSVMGWTAPNGSAMCQGVDFH